MNQLSFAKDSLIAAFSSLWNEKDFRNPLKNKPTWPEPIKKSKTLAPTTMMLGVSKNAANGAPQIIIDKATTINAKKKFKIIMGFPS